MIKLNKLLTESYVNVFTREEKEPYAKEVWDILQRSYAKIGGFKGSPDVDDLIDDSWLWKMNRKNGKIISVRIYKDKLGRKSIAAGSDGSDAGKASLFKTLQDDIKLERFWGEASGKMLHILMNKLNAQPVPNEFAAKILGKKILKLHSDGYTYTRLIAGEPHDKIILVGKDVGTFLDKVNKKIQDGTLKESDIF